MRNDDFTQQQIDVHAGREKSDEQKDDFEYEKHVLLLILFPRPAAEVRVILLAANNAGLQIVRQHQRASSLIDRFRYVLFGFHAFLATKKLRKEYEK
jgi:hypothetical protein